MNEPTPPAKKKRVHVFLEVDLLEWLREKAAAEYRSVGRQLSKIVVEAKERDDRQSGSAR